MRESIAAILARARDAAVPADGPARSLSSGGHYDRRAAILAEIDETVLPRALTFAIGEARMTLEARGRRVLRITAVAPERKGAAGALARLAAGGLAEAEEVKLIAELIHGFAANDGVLGVLAERSDLPPSIVDKGHAPATILAAAPELAPPAPKPGSPKSQASKPESTAPAAARKPRGKGVEAGRLAAFHEGCVAFAKGGAIVDAEGRLATEHGEPRAARVAAGLGKEASGRFLDAALPGPKLTILGDGTGSRLCIARAEGAAVVAEIGQKHLDDTVAAWRAAAS